MAPPTLVAEYEVSNWTIASTPKSVSVTTSVGDWLIWIGATRDAGTTVNTLSAGTGMTWSFPVFSLTAATCGMYIGVAQATTAETFTLTGTAVSGGTLAQWGFNCFRFSGCTGVGAGNSLVSTGIPSVSLTTTQQDSAIVIVNADWNAIDGSARVWLTNAGTLTEQTYARVGGGYTVYGGYHANAGAPGAKTVGLNNIAGQKYTIGALEILGIPGGTVSPNNSNNRKRSALLVR